ncbi:MAG: hypothetical protein ACTSUS_07015 [Candidatus Freyarchaeota archaeon]
MAKKDLEKERRELEGIFKSIDRRVKKYGELTEEEIQREIVTEI